MKIQKKKQKESIVVSYETGYEYACVTSGTAISDVPEEKWDGYADRLGNYEIKNLTNNTEYVLYKRLKGCSEMYAQTTFSLDKNADEFEIILKEPDQTTIDSFNCFTIVGSDTVIASPVQAKSTKSFII